MVKEIFEHYIENSFCDEKQADFKIRQFSFNYKRFFPADKNAALLDIGIGRGEMLSCMEKWGYENYFGIDISPSTIRFCKSINLQCELIDDSIGWLRNHKGIFDLITLLDVLEHIKKEDTISFLRSLHGALKSNGVLIIQVPNLQAPDGQLHRYNDFTHEVGYVQHSLQQVLLTAGFKKIEYYGFEDILQISWKDPIRYVLRFLFWKCVRFMRRVSGNLNPEILHPVLFAMVVK